MKKILIILLCVMTLGITYAQATEETWDIKVTQITETKSLTTDQQVALYTGDTQIITHVDEATIGYKYLILDLSVEKIKTNNEVFNVANIKLEIENEQYEQIDSSFLSKHKYSQFTKLDVRFGKSDGTIAFLIPETTDLSDVVLQVYDTSIMLQVSCIITNTNKTNIPVKPGVIELS